MRSIEIEDDIYEHLLQNTQEIGESASSILRRLLKISPRTEPEVDTPTLPTGKHPKLQLLLSRLDLSLHRTAVDRFLAILSVLYQLHKDKFRRVLDLGGRNRTYFAESEKEIEERGSSTQPKRIAGTPFYVVTNNDTPKKQRMLQKVLERLDYEYAEAQNIAIWVDPTVRIPSFTGSGRAQRAEDGETDLKI
jgi:negative modulator of initiation of replication